MTQQDIKILRKSTKDVGKFFFYICIQMIIQGLYRLVIVIVEVPAFQSLSIDDCFLDIMLIPAQMGMLLMNFGITQSVKRAYQAEVKKRKSKNKSFNTVTFVEEDM